MTYQEYAIRRKRRCKKQLTAILTVIGIELLLFGLGMLYGWHLGTIHVLEPVPQQFTEQGRAIPQITTNADTPSTPGCNLIVSEGNTLSMELQNIMQEKCKEYGVPYALALALADQETRFDPDAVSSTNDYGLMQINSINFEWLKEKGIDPLTYEGNIEAGVLILSEAINRYGDYGLALMAYNCGDTGAKRLWDAGTYSTKYSREVLERYNKWVQIVEGN